MIKRKRNAIIMAAGMSTRFVPLSYEKPKALLKVKGEVLIERQIHQLREAGIQEIIIVVGYLKEQFRYLEEKYGVILIENPVYQFRNNHSTLYAARQYLKNTFICSGDNYFARNVFLRESAVSYYAAVYVSGKTNEWCLKTGNNGRIEEVCIGGCDSWVMKGHAYFTEDFSNKMIPYLLEAYVKDEDKDKFWEDIYIEHLNELDMYIQKYEDGIIEEFDSVEELRCFDSSYLDYTGSRIMEKISRILVCKESEITGLYPVKNQGQAEGFGFKCRNHSYRYLFRTEVLKEVGEIKDGK